MATMDRQTAEAEYKRWADAMGIDTDISGAAAADAEDYTRFSNRVITAIAEGHAVVNDDVELEYTPQKSGSIDGPIVFYTPRGSAYMASKATDGIKRLFDAAAEITKRPAGLFARMQIQDTKFVIAVTTLFLAP